MRKFKMGIIALAASAALIPAGVAQAGDPKDHNDGQCNGSINVASCFTVNDVEIGTIGAIVTYITKNCVGVAVPVLGNSAQCGSATIFNLPKW